MDVLFWNVVGGAVEAINSIPPAYTRRRIDMFARLLIGTLGLLLIDSGVVHTQAPHEKQQCPAVMAKLNEDIANAKLVYDQCLQQPQDTVFCREGLRLLQTLTITREKSCRESTLPQGYCGCP
jgi:hypothetical protein